MAEKRTSLRHTHSFGIPRKSPLGLDVSSALWEEFWRQKRYGKVHRNQ